MKKLFLALVTIASLVSCGPKERKTLQVIYENGNNETVTNVIDYGRLDKSCTSIAIDDGSGGCGCGKMRTICGVREVVLLNTYVIEEPKDSEATEEPKDTTSWLDKQIKF